MGGGRFLSMFWFRQVINGTFWWFALGALLDATVGSGSAASSWLKAMAFGLLAALVTWKLPPYTAGLTPMWWGRFMLAVGLWLAALDRFWHVSVRGWSDGIVPWSALGGPLLFALIAGVVGWFVLPRQTVLP